MMVGALVLPVVTVGITDGIDDAQPANATHAQPWVDDRRFIRAHAAGADGVEHAGAAGLRVIGELLVSIAVGAGPQFLNAVRRPLRR